MTRAGFLAARALRLERPLAALSVPLSELTAAVSGRSVALVGNARALSHADHGSAIDAADVVIRINRAPMPSTRTHGRRTDWLALATSIADDDLARIRPKRILWMSPKRKRLPFAVATSPGFYLHPVADIARLSAALGAPPTTGLMMIDLLARTELSRLTLYGFDFFASLSLTGSRTAAQVPHDFPAERRFADALIARDPRTRLA
jgi:Glycosyltransferase family 29 (sialyltransferase)